MGVYIVWSSFYSEELMTMWEGKAWVVALFGVAVFVAGGAQALFPARLGRLIDPGMRSFRLESESNDSAPPFSMKRPDQEKAEPTE